MIKFFKSKSEIQYTITNSNEASVDHNKTFVNTIRIVKVIAIVAVVKTIVEHALCRRKNFYCLLKVERYDDMALQVITLSRRNEKSM